MPSYRSVGLGLVAAGAAIGALIPVFLALYPAAGLAPADAGKPAALLAVVARTPALFVVPGLLEIAGHVVGAIAILGLWWRLGRKSFALSAATVAGLAWMAVDVLDNALALQLVPKLAASHAAGDAAAAGTFGVIGSLIDGIRLGGHLAGGLWVVGASTVLVRARAIHPVVGYAGVVVGAVLAANPIVPALLNVSFMTLPAWLVLFGIAVARLDGQGARVAALTRVSA